VIEMVRRAQKEQASAIPGGPGGIGGMDFSVVAARRTSGDPTRCGGSLWRCDQRGTRWIVAIGTGNRLKEIREREGIPAPALAKASGISERIIRRVEEVDGAPRLEIKARLVAGLNALLGSERYRTDEVFAGWQPHRRLARR
jgi:hypothetical protein